VPFLPEEGIERLAVGIPSVAYYHDIIITNLNNVRAKATILQPILGEIHTVLEARVEKKKSKKTDSKVKVMDRA
jgi:hypothetical protein